jgi:D-glycero-alpha-D-manno-heptose 1-phosphate guanylyltransferase
MNATRTAADFKPTELLILAGGLGTRLRQAVADVPKPMAPVNGIPFLDYLMAHWSDQGVRRFVLSVGYMADSVRSHFGTRFRDCAVDYATESTPLGTGGAIRNALVRCTWANERLVIVNGDTWFPVQLDALAADAGRLGKPVTIAVKRIADNDRYGGIVLDESGIVRQFVAGSQRLANPVINGGAYLVDRAYLTERMRYDLEPFSFERDVLEPLAAAGLLAASMQDVRFLDIGVPEDYLRADELVLRDTIRQPHPN